MRPVRPCGDVDCPCQGAEQNAELRERIGGGCIGCNHNDGPDECCPMHGRTLVDWMDIASEVIGRHNDDRAEIERLRAELSALRATDEYQRWARAVTERDAARVRITKALQFVNHELADAVLTEFDDGAHSALAVVRAALDGTAT